jgi:hypothetical protein
MNDTPRFVEKHRATDNTNNCGSPWEFFSTYLDHLDAKDWSDFLEDLLFYQTSAIYEVVAPPPGTDLLDYTARLLLQASAFSLTQCTRVLDQVLARASHVVVEGSSTDPVMRGLRLTEMIGVAARVTAASSMVLNAALPEEVRARAALVVSDRITHVRWDNVDLRRDSFLLPAVVIARMQEDPIKAVHALVETPSLPHNSEYLSYPLRIALRRICRDPDQGGIARAARLLENLPLSHWSRAFVWGRTLRLKEFVRLREYLGLEGEIAAPVLTSPPDPQAEQEHTEIANALAEAKEAVWQGDILEWLDDAGGDGPAQRLRKFAAEGAAQ